jgi:hypothetical protein
MNGRFSGLVLTTAILYMRAETIDAHTYLLNERSDSHAHLEKPKHLLIHDIPDSMPARNLRSHL